MRIRLDLDLETTKRLVAIALVERRSASDQAQVLLERVLGVRPNPSSYPELPLMLETDLQSHGI
jgi:hypothetical protein